MTHLLQFLFRVLLAFLIMPTLPLSHAYWGQPYPGDGQKGFGILMMLALFGMAVAAVYLVLGSVGQFMLRRRAFRASLLLDLTLFVLISLILAIVGVTAKYSDAEVAVLNFARFVRLAQL